MKNNASSVSFNSVQGKVALILAGTIAALLTAPPGQAATIKFDGGPSGTGTALDTAVNWTGDVLPATSSEVIFDPLTLTPPPQLTTTGASLTWGDLIWNTTASSAITIATTSSTSQTITLSGAGGNTEAIAQGGAAGDLILMGNGSTVNTLSIGGNASTGTGRLGLVLGASGNFDVVNSSSTLNVTGLLSGNFNLTKTGAGALTLSGANTFGSATTTMALTAGTLNINSSTALGTSTNTFVINGGTIDNTSGAALTTSAYKQTWNGDFAFTGTNNLSFSTGTVSLGTAAGTARTVAVNANTLTIGGIISDSTTAKGLVKDGAGTLVLNGVNTFTGGSTVRNGTLVARVPAALGTGTITLGDSSGSNNAALLGFYASTTLIVTNPIVVASGSSGTTTLGVLTDANTATTYSGTISLGHDLVAANFSQNYLTLPGVISETGGAHGLIVNALSGTIAITGTNTFTGGVTLNSGRLQFGVTNSTGTGPFTINHGVIDATVAATLNNSSYLLNGDFSFTGTTGVTFATGGVTLGGNRVVTTNASTLTINEAIADGGNGYSLTKSGIGTLALNGTSTFSGATIVQRGILNLTGANSGLAGTSGLAILGGTANYGTTTGAGLANRIKTDSTLTLGGSGIFSINAAATATVNNQSFAGLSVAPGSGQLSNTALANAGVVSFTGSAASAYTRAIGGTVRIAGLAPTFANAPTGSSTIGSGSSAMLIGATYGSAVAAAGVVSTGITDFVKAAAGPVSAPTYGPNTWSTGVNTDVTGAMNGSGATQSLRFNFSGNLTVTLAGTTTIESGGILVGSGAVGGGVITGGTLQAASGQDLWILTSASTNGRHELTVNSLIADNGGSSLTKTGGRTLFLTNAGNTYSGGTFLGEGTLNIAAPGALGTGALNFTGNATLQAGAPSIDLGTRSVPVAAGQTATFDSNANSITASGVISGAGGLTKSGLGTLVLSGANTYTGTTIVNGGTLKLDFNAPGAPLSNIINPSSLVSPGSSVGSTYTASTQTVIIQGGNGMNNTQSFLGTYSDNLGNAEATGIYLTKGITHLNFAAGTGGTLTVNLGSFGRGASTDQNANFDISIGANVAVTTSNASTTVPIGGWATVNGNTWAQSAGGFIVPFSNYSSSYGTASAILDAGAGGTLSANPNLLRFNANTAATVAPGVGVVRAISAGGILITAAVGENTTAISAGALTGYSARDLIVHQNNTAGDFRIDANITDVGARTLAFSKDGPGKVILTAPNTYTGYTLINEGTLLVTADAVAGFSRAATSTATSATITVSDTAGIFIGQAVTGGGLSTTVTNTVVGISGTSVTLSNPASTASSAALSFGAGSALGGLGTTITYVATGATLQIGDGGTTGSPISTQTLSVNGSLILNRSNDYTFANAFSGSGFFEKQGAGNVSLSNSSTFAGETKISGGTITPTVTTALQNSTLNYNGYGGSLSFGTLTGATLGGLKGSQNLALVNTANAAVTLTIGQNQLDTTYSGSFSGIGGINKTGGGALTLAGASTQTGVTNLLQGTINLTGSFTDPGSLSLSAGIFNVSGAFTRTVYSSAAAVTLTNGAILNVTGSMGGSATAPTGSLSVAGNSVVNFSGTEFISGTNTSLGISSSGTGTVNLTAGTLTTGTTSGGIYIGRSAAGLTPSGYLNISGGTMTHTANTTISVGTYFSTNNGTETSGPSAITLSGTGMFDTGTSSGARFELGSSTAGNAIGTGTINLDGGTLATNRTITGGSVGASTFNFNGGTFKANGTAATLSTTLTAANIRNGGAVIDTNGFAVTLAKALTHSVIAGDNVLDGGLLKKGAGTLTLSGSSTYTGPTSIQDGNLTISGSLSATSSVELAVGTLTLSGGSERINNSASFNLGGTLSFANSLTGVTETMGALTLTNTSFLDFGTGNSNTFLFSNLALAENYLYIFNWTGSFYNWGDSDHGGTQDRLLFGANVSAEALSHILFYSDSGATPIGFGGQIAFGQNFEIVPIPEPSSAALLGSIGLLGLVGFGRRLRGRRPNRQ